MTPTKISITINGSLYDVSPEMTVLEAARSVGINIPTLCHYKGVHEDGRCRICVVEIKGQRVLQASCVYPVANGMEITTDSDEIRNLRKTILELMLGGHPSDCLNCEKSSGCVLQDLAYEYGARIGEFNQIRKQVPVSDPNPLIIRDMNKCIQCGLCVAVCEDGVLDVNFRGVRTAMTPAFNRCLEETPCTFCGMCISVCPTGALSEKMAVGAGRAHQLKRTLTTCVYCGCGCTIELQTRDDRLVKITSSPENPENGNFTCIKGRFGYDFVHHKERLQTPLIKNDNGTFRVAGWDEALDLIADRLAGIKSQHGPDALMAFSSARITNEENYTFQKFFRAVIGTNNIDHCARLCHAPTISGLAKTLGSASMTNPIADIEHSRTLLVIGSNTTEQHPFVASKMKKAVARGANLIVCDPRQIPLTQYATLWIRHRPGSDAALLCGMMNLIISNDWIDHDFIRNNTEGFDRICQSVQPYTLQKTSLITGVSPDLIERAARLYALEKPSGLYYAMGITQHTTGTDNVYAVSNLCLMTGNIGKPGAGLNPLRGQNNVQGSCDMGALPNVYPGYHKVIDLTAMKKFAAAWGVDSLSTKPGLTLTESFDAMLDGRIRALWAVGENPMMSDPDVNHVESALKKLDFMVVQDLFLTETAKLAHVVLPSASFVEKDGTFTSTERRVQRVRAGISPVGSSRTDWQIVADLAGRMGYQGMGWENSLQIMDEIRSLIPFYHGITYQRIEKRGICWPCPSLDHPGTPLLHLDGKFTGGKGQFMPVEFNEPAELPSEEYPLTLTSGRILAHWHTGTMTRRSRGIAALNPLGFVEINTEDAELLDISQGELVRVISRRGSVDVPARIGEMTPPKVIFMTFHFHEHNVNVLTNDVRDPVSQIPEFKVCAARVEKISV